MRNATKTEGNGGDHTLLCGPADDETPKSGFVRPSGRTELPPKKVKRRTEGQFKTRACLSSAYCAGVGYGFLNESAGNATTSLQRESVN